MKEERCDVLIVGSGGAALRAAIAAQEAQPQARVLVATKGQLGRSGVTATACSDRMAFHATLATTEPAEPEAWRYHADDIYRIGGSVSDGDLAEILARNAAARFADLDRWGVPFARRPDGTVDQFVTDGSKYARACYTGPYTANHIEAALVTQIVERNIELLENTLVAELIPAAEGNRIAGALTVDERTGDVGLIRAKTVVLATGGAGQAYAVNVFPPESTGDGYAMAFRRGAELVNMEFIQIGLSSVKTKLACSGSMMRALPRMVNSAGREFLPDYFPPGTDWGHIYTVLFAKGASWPVSYQEPSHVIDIAVYYELVAGRRVYLDYGHNPTGLEPSALDEKVLRWYNDAKSLDWSNAEIAGSPLARLRAINPQVVVWLAERGIDLAAGDMIDLAPAIQHFQGGVKIRTRGDTTVAGLFAAGEVAGGQHGANRPGGNALLDSQVFGTVAGENAAADAAAMSDWPDISEAGRQAALDWLQALKGGPDALPATQARNTIQQTMSRVASVVRVRELLDEGMAQLDEIVAKGIRVDAKGLAYAVETANILTCGRLVIAAARERPESRGPHLMFARFGDLEPLPADPAWERYIVLQGEDSRVATALRTPAPLPGR